MTHRTAWWSRPGHSCDARHLSSKIHEAIDVKTINSNQVFFCMHIGAVMSWTGGTTGGCNRSVEHTGIHRFSLHASDRYVPFFFNAARSTTWYQWYNVCNIRYSKLPRGHTLMRVRALICTRGTALKPQQAQHNTTRTNGGYRIKEYRPPSTHIISRFAVRPILLPIWTTSPSRPFSSPLQFPAAVCPSSISR